jgi:hypothetical protein
MVELQDPGDARSYRIGALDRMVKSSCPDWGNIAQSALDLIGNRQRGHEVTTCGPDVFAGGQDRSQIVAGVTGFPLGQVAIIEIEVAYQCTVVESSSVNVSEPAANQCTVARAA